MKFVELALRTRSDSKVQNGFHVWIVGIYISMHDQFVTYCLHISLFTAAWQSSPNLLKVWYKNPLWETIAISFSSRVHNLVRTKRCQVWEIGFLVLEEHWHRIIQNGANGKNSEFVQVGREKRAKESQKAEYGDWDITKERKNYCSLPQIPEQRLVSWIQSPFVLVYLLIFAFFPIHGLD